MTNKQTKRRSLFIIALAALIGFTMAGCEQPTETLTLTGITANYTGGSVAVNTDVNSLKSNITVTAKYSDYTTKTVTDYSLIGNLSASGLKPVAVIYEHKTTTFNVTVTDAPIADITYTATQTGGTNNTADTTGIAFTFSASVTGLTVDDITVTSGIGAVTKGTLSGSGSSWTLGVTVTTAGNITIAIAKSGIEAETKDVTVYKAGQTAPTLTGIIAVYTQGSTIIYPTTPLDSLKAGLTVIAAYSNGTIQTATAYTLSVSGGTLTVGASTVTVTYEGKIATFNVTVTTAPQEQWPPNAIPFTENQWADGDIPTSGDVQWFTFTATASTQYIHAYFGVPLYVQVYDSSGATVGSETILYGSTTYTSRSLTSGHTYYIRMRSYGSGTYQIGFNTTVYPPGTSLIPLTESQWADGNLPTSTDVQWFTFTATASTQYIHFAPSTLTIVRAQVYDSSGTTVGSEANLYSSTTNTSRSLTVGQTYYIRVTSYSSSYNGTYQIGFTATIIPPGVAPIPLTANQWADGNLTTSSDVQWFTFTATASTQYIHFDFTGTLQYVYVQVYDSIGATLGSETNLSSSSTNKYTSRTLTAGQTYYIRVRPYSSSYSGTYRIVFNTTVYPPGVTPIPLTANQWADGNIPTAGGQQWFTFNATASTQYIHFVPGTLGSVYVQVYDSSGAMSGSETNLYSSTTNTSRTLTTGQTYYIRVRPTSSTGSGAYRIAFNTTVYPPGVTSIPLTANQWAAGNLPSSNSEQWFSFTATAVTQYIHFDPTGTLTSVSVQVYDSSGAAVGSDERLYSSTTNISRTLSTGQTYYIRARPYSSSYGGTYRIRFNTTFYPPGTTFIPLTENQWANDNLPSSNSEQWFTFTATASTQYIHADFGTLTELYVQVYGSSGTAVGSETNLDSRYSSSKRTSKTLTMGQTYYIRVRPYSSSYSGTYRITFNKLPLAPFATSTWLTSNQWFSQGNSTDNWTEQWFTFTATASTQYIHFAPGVLKNVDVTVYASDGQKMVAANLYGNGATSRASGSLTIGQTYYIMVESVPTNGSYRIAFNASTTPPP